MDKVGDAVVSALEQRLFQPERRKRLAVLRSEETEVSTAIRALFMMVESGATAPDDPFLKERLATLKLRLSSLGEEMRQIGAKSGRITPEKVERFAAAMRAKLRDAAGSRRTLYPEGDRLLDTKKRSGPTQETATPQQLLNIQAQVQAGSVL